MRYRTWVSTQTVIDDCWKFFTSQADLSQLPGVRPDHFGFKMDHGQYLSKNEDFGREHLAGWRNLYLPHGGLITAGAQRGQSDLNWNGQRLPYLALVNCDSMGVGVGYIVLLAEDLHPAISHMIYNDIPFDKDSKLYGQKCLSLDICGGAYAPFAGSYRVFIASSDLLKATSELIERR